MKRVSRDVDPSEVFDLLQKGARACIAVAGHDGPRIETATVAFRDGRYLVGVPAESTALPADGEEIVLLVDEGCQYFELRALYVRGRVAPPAETEHLGEDSAWLVVEPARVTAWDYGRMQETDDEP